jgi:hypothetical protein
VISIGGNAFSGCTGLTSVTIHGNVTEVGWWVFQNTGLTSVTIGNGVTAINWWMFDGTSLTTIDVASDNARYTSIDGVVYTKNVDTLVICPSGKTGTITIPSSVVAITSSFASLTAIDVASDNARYASLDGLLYTKNIETLFICPDRKTGTITIPGSVSAITSSFGRLTAIDVASDNARYTSVDGILYSKDVDTLFAYPGGRAGVLTIPASVTEITASGFSSLRSIIALNPEPPIIRPYIFPWGVTVYVPDGAVEAYMADSLVVQSDSGLVNIYNYWRDLNIVDSVPPALYAVSVVGGTGAGSYAAGDTVTLAVGAAPVGQEFKSWDIAPAVAFVGGSGIASSSVRFVMPEADIAAAAVYEEVVSVVSTDRVIPQTNPTADIAAVVPVNHLSAEFVAGPNPVSRSSGTVGFFRQGSRLEIGALTIFDVSGNVVGKVNISDRSIALSAQSRRHVGSWDLRDGKGRQVSEGTYLVKGMIKTSDGKVERVSLVLGVR